MWKQIGKYSGLVIALLVVLLAATAVFLTLPPGERWLKSLVENEGSGALGRTVTIGALQTNLFSYLAMDDIRIAGRSGDPEMGAVTVGRIEVRYSLLSALKERFAISSLFIDSVIVAIARDSSGQFILPLETSPDTVAATSPSDHEAGNPLVLPVSIDTAHVGRIRITYGDVPLDAHAQISDGSISLGRTDHDSYQCEVNLDQISASLDSLMLPAISFRTRLSLSPDAVRLDTLSVQIAQLQLAARGALKLGVDTTFDASLAISGKPDAVIQPVIRHLGLPAIETTGELNIIAGAQGNTESMEAESVSELPEVRSGGISTQRSQVGLSYRSDTLFVDTLMVPTFGGSIAGRGVIALDSMIGTQMNLAINSLDMQQLWSALYEEVSPYEGSFDGVLQVSNDGTDISDWRVEGSLRGTRLTYAGKSLPDLKGNVTLSGGRLILDIEQQELGLAVDLSIEDEALDGSFTATLPRLDIVAGLANFGGVTGSLEAGGTLGGTLSNPAIRAQIAGDSIVYENFPVDRLNATLSYLDSVLTFASLTLSGSVDSIDAARPLFGLDSLGGGFSYTVTGSGTLDDPSAQIGVSFGPLGYGSYAVDSGAVEMSVKGRTATLEPSRIFAQRLALGLTGSANIDSLAGNLSLRITDLGHGADSSVAAESSSAEDPTVVGQCAIEFNVSDTTDLELYARGDSLAVGAFSALLTDSLALGGLVSFEGAFRGAVDNPTGSLALSVIKPTYDDIVLDSIDMRLRFSRHRLDIDTLTIAGLGQDLNARMFLQFSRDSVGGYTITTEDSLGGVMQSNALDLRALEPFLSEGGTIEGKGSVNVRFRGTIGEPHVEGDIRVTDARLSPASGMDTVQNIQLLIALEDSALTFRQATAQLRGSEVAISGNAVFTQERRIITTLTFETERFGTLEVTGSASQDSLDLHAKVDTLRLSAFSRLVPEVDTLGGLLSCVVSATGSPDDPVLDGSFTVRGLVIKPTILDSAITDGTAVVSFDRNTARIDSLSARIGEGRVWATGSLTLTEGSVSGVDIVMFARQISLSSKDVFVLGVDTADIYFHGANGAFTLSGPVVLGETRFVRDFDLTDVLAMMRETERVEQGVSPLQQQTTLDLRLRDNGSLWVDNNLARIRLSAGTGVIGTLAKPNLTGRVRVEEGYLLYLDREFKITRGVAFFSDPAQINPDIDFAATAEVTVYSGTSSTKYIIVLEVTGPLDNYQTRLYSTSHPDLNRSDVISLLTVGATRQQLTGSSQGEVLADRAGELVSRRIAGYASRQVEEALGLSEVSVQGNLFNPNQNGGPQLLVSKSLSQQVKVTYSTRVGGKNEQSIRLDYRLSDHWSFEGETNQVGEAILNIKYGLRFK
ncbi:translocation/assembly module TamB domain-containing protein [bacterium]|nr:translocation/assembly module TamB domain-containing protein [bacterium]